MTKNENKWTENSLINDVINDPVFEDYGRLLFPVDSNFFSGKTLKDLKLTWYSNISPKDTVDVVNFLYNRAKIGEKVFRQNQYAVVTMAGGQGTRLGWKGPKGTFKLDVGENGKYIFEILANTLKRTTAKYGKEVYWYIMTSIDNNDETIRFFQEHEYFGYNPEKVKFFEQNVLPILDFEGSIRWKWRSIYCFKEFKNDRRHEIT